MPRSGLLRCAVCQRPAPRRLFFGFGIHEGAEPLFTQAFIRVLVKGVVFHLNTLSRLFALIMEVAFPTGAGLIARPRNVAAPEILLPAPLRNRALVEVAIVIASSTPLTILLCHHNATHDPRRWVSSKHPCQPETACARCDAQLASRAALTSVLLEHT